MTVPQVLFLAVALVSVVSALMVATSPRLVHAALWLVVTLATVAVLFILLDAAFLAMVQVAVYIGAIAILIIFAVMLTRRVMADSGPQANRGWWLAVFIGLLMFGGLVALLVQVPGWWTATPAAISAAPDATITELGRALVDPNRYVVPFEVASVLLVAALIGAIVLALPAGKGEVDG